MESVVPISAIRDASDNIVSDFPYVSLSQGTNGSQARINWPKAVRGTVAIMARMDRPD